MSSGQGFLAGLGDFLAAPTRLWRMHRRLIALDPKARAMEEVQLHRLERNRRVQLRTRMMDSYSATSTPSIAPSAPHAALTDSSGLFQPLVRMWLINVGLILILPPFYLLDSGCTFFSVQLHRFDQSDW
ncbi:unnamed protein product [Echinostoma caproni]|uniref:Transmembrane protein n=1 Tax=Echinostoma caproni TaxID=27848 RepID=A0A183AZJ3_9TREM|nr:unnamed protein product [Echinostoma caproni]